MASYIPPGAFLAHVANPIVARFGGFPALIVRGRRSGRLLTIPMGEPLRLAGRRYLVSGRGETHWVRNLRSARRAAFRLHGRTSPFRPTEVFGPEHDRVVEAYRRKLGHGVDRYFAEIPDVRDHPVFRMDPAEQDALSQPGRDQA